MMYYLTGTEVDMILDALDILQPDTEDADDTRLKLIDRMGLKKVNSHISYKDYVFP